MTADLKILKPTPGASLPERFGEVAMKMPDRPALSLESGDLSYSRLQDKAWSIAAELAPQSKAGEPIALLIQDPVDAVAALFGCMAAGGVCLPLDPATPIARIGSVMENSGARILLHDGDAGRFQPLFGFTPLQIGELGQAGRSFTLPPIDPDQPAMLYYTSGSTGEPKGVPQTHTNILQRIQSHLEGLGLMEYERRSSVLSLSFSASLLDFFCTMLSGSTLCPFPVRERPLSDLTRWLKDQRITIFHPPVAYLQQWVGQLKPDDNFPHVTSIRLGGEVVTGGLLNRLTPHFNPDCLIQVTLASTEASLHALFRAPLASAPFPEQLTFGMPDEGRELLILDDAHQILPEGEVGEIAIRSRFLSPGYWRSPQLTAKRFLDDPRGSDRRIFLTGDLGRVQHGRLTLMGRIDNMVKIRGHSVHAEEVERAVRALKGVRQAAVVASQGADGRAARLWGFIVAGSEFGAPDIDWRAILRQTLPDYMVPSGITLVEALPRLPNGKVDRQHLTQSVPATPDAEEAAVPGESVEAKLTQIWSRMLGMHSIRLDDDFFALGGHSLLALQLMAEIERVTGRRLPPTVLFEAPTIRSLTDRVMAKPDQREWSSLVSVQSLGDQPAFFCASPLIVDVMAYRHLAVALGSDQPFYALYDRERRNIGHSAENVHHEARTYLTAIREVQPSGPYFIGGYSFGGRIAYEMARQLEAAGEQVGLLVLIETYGPEYMAPAKKLHPAVRTWLDGLASLQVNVLNMLPWVQMHLSELRQLDWAGRRRYIDEKLRGQRAAMVRRIERLLRRVVGQESEAAKAASAVKYPVYDPGQFGGSVLLLKASRQPAGASDDHYQGWSEFLTGPVEVQSVPGMHDSILFGPRIKILANKLRAALEQSRSGLVS